MTPCELLAAKGLTFADLASVRYYLAGPDYHDDIEAFVTLVAGYFDGAPHCPLTAVGVTALAEPGQRVEVEAIAVY